MSWPLAEPLHHGNDCQATFFRMRLKLEGCPLDRARPSPDSLKIAVVALALAWAGAAPAAEGATEINQASVLAGGGFPLVISSPGNYVLTSDLTPPASTQAISIVASDVFLDLQGFRIVGSHACSVGGCQTGTVNGISGQEGSGRRVTVKGGAIEGFSGTCIALLGESYVSEMFVSRCGRHGIQLSQGSLVRASRVTETGRQGLLLVGDEIGYSENVVFLTGLAVSSTGPESVGIDGGSALGANVCLRGGCAPRGRRYYITDETYLGNEAADPGNCDAGFHFATVYEILDPTQLTYDADRGATATDQGSGPRARLRGWIRTGSGTSGAFPRAGEANCMNWSSPSLSLHGSVVSLGGSPVGTPTLQIGNWDDGLLTLIPPWIGGTQECSFPAAVWCVEDQ